MSLACRQCYVAPKSTRSTQKRQQLAVCPSFNHSPAVLVVQNHVGFYAEVQTYFPPHLSPFVFLFVRATLVALVGLIKSISIQKQYLFSTQLLSLTQVQNGKSEQISLRGGRSGEGGSEVWLERWNRSRSFPSSFSRTIATRSDPHRRRVSTDLENGCPLSIYPSVTHSSPPLYLFDPLMVQTDAQESYAFSADINQLLSLSKFARHPRSANPYPRLRQQHGHVSPTELRSNPSFSLLLSLYT